MKIPVVILDRYRWMIIDKYSPFIIVVAANHEGDETNPEHLLWMLNQIELMDNYGKANRWLGFVQGILISHGITTVTNERNATRGMFHE